MLGAFQGLAVPHDSKKDKQKPMI